MQILKITP